MITSVDNPRVKEVLRLRRSGQRRETGLFVAEGRREVERAVAAGLAVRALYVAPELMPDWRGTQATELPDRTSRGPRALMLNRPGGALPEPMPDRPGGVAPDPTDRPRSTAPAPRQTRRPGGAATATPTVTEVSARVLAHMSYRTEPEGVLGVFEIPVRALPPEPTLVLVAVGIEKPGNLGAMARTADAAGADGLLVADAQVDPWNPNAVRASTGAVFTLPIVETTREELDALPLRKVAATLGVALTHTHDRPAGADGDPDRRGGRRAFRRLARAGRLRGRDPDERSDGGLAERECRRRRAALRSRPPANGARLERRS